MSTTPIFEWKFDKNTWPHQSFFGRRWVELWGGRVVAPANGCLYFWGCILSSIAWFSRGTFLFPFRHGYHAAGKYIDSLPEPTAKQQSEKLQLKAPRWLKTLGRSAHWILATKFSPFRFSGVVIRDVIIVVTDSISGFFTAFGDLIMGIILMVLGLSFIIGAATLLILFTISILNIIVFATIGMLIAVILMGLFYLVISSGIFQLIWMMITAGKHKVCPAIVIK